MATFHELHTLIQLITDHSQQPLPLLGKLERQSGKETTLFENIQNGRYTDDAQAATDLYGNGTPDKRYAMLKARLYQKLLNHLFFLDFNNPRFVPCIASEQESLTLLHQAKMLINTENYELAEDLLKRSLKIAKELGFTSICIECLEWWRYLYIRHGQVKPFHKNQQQLAYFRSIAEYEKEAESMYFMSRLEMNKPVESRKKYLPQLLSVLSSLKELWEKHHSINIFDFYYKLNIWYHELIGDFTEIIRITTESEQLLQQQLIHPIRFEDYINKYMQVYAYLRVKNFDKGLQLAEAYLPSFYPSTNNWFAYMENYLLMAVHAQQYDLALRLMKQVDDNAAFRKITIRVKEKWILYRAYLYLVYPPDN